MDFKLISAKDIKNLRKDIKNLQKTNAELQEKWLSSEDAAKFLGVSKRTLQRYRESGKIPYSKDSRMIWHKQSDLVKYLNKNYCSIISNTNDD